MCNKRVKMRLSESERRIMTESREIYPDCDEKSIARLIMKDKYTPSMTSQHKRVKELHDIIQDALVELDSTESGDLIECMGQYALDMARSVARDYGGDQV